MTLQDQFNTLKMLEKKLLICAKRNDIDSFILTLKNLKFKTEFFSDSYLSLKNEHGEVLNFFHAPCGNTFKIELCSNNVCISFNIFPKIAGQKFVENMKDIFLTIAKRCS